MDKGEIGRYGEQLATDHLIEQGLVVLERNWRCAEGEIDIVASDGLGTLIICEVKTRTGLGFGSPAEAVTVVKRRKLRRLAQVYLQRCAIRRWVVIRFDVVGVLLGGVGGTPAINHIEQAF